MRGVTRPNPHQQSHLNLLLHGPIPARHRVPEERGGGVQVERVGGVGTKRWEVPQPHLPQAATGELQEAQVGAGAEGDEAEAGGTNRTLICVCGG